MSVDARIRTAVFGSAVVLILLIATALPWERWPGGGDLTLWGIAGGNARGSEVARLLLAALVAYVPTGLWAAAAGTRRPCFAAVAVAAVTLGMQIWLREALGPAEQGPSAGPILAFAVTVAAIFVFLIAGLAAPAKAE